MSGQSIAVVIKRRTSKDSAVENLGKARISIVQENRNLNDNGWRIRTDVGAIVLVYDAGKMAVHGKNSWLVREALGLRSRRQRAHQSL